MLAHLKMVAKNIIVHKKVGGIVAKNITDKKKWQKWVKNVTDKKKVAGMGKKYNRQGMGKK